MFYWDVFHWYVLYVVYFIHSDLHNKITIHLIVFFLIIIPEYDNILGLR